MQINQEATGRRSKRGQAETSNGRAPADKAPAVTRAAAILRLLADSCEPLGVNAIGKALDLVPSTCLHILRALVADQLVAVDPESKRYCLDVGILSLARGLLRQGDFASIAQPHLDAIARTHGVTTIAAKVLGLRNIVVVALSESAVAFRLHVDIGSRFPALISASGRCIAAFGGHNESELRTAFKRLRWHDAPSYETWWAEVETTRSTSIGIDAGNYINGITVVATPVFDLTGTMSHALVAVGVREQLSSDVLNDLGADLQSAARSLSGHSGGLT